ncbi:hypothetical protein FXO38_21510 [Capsicum annuum]|nr:hypothetical protein FXO37_23175 [Capsicum annuum]KAF3641710.1 hypothetical protein FXO38_21510 [Capsicum annuum]
MEPFQDGQYIEEYRRRLGIKHAVLNVTGKIWAFMVENMEFSIVKDEEKKLTMKVSNQNADILLLVTLVDAKCNANERVVLWDSLTDLSDSYQVPWLIGGDFNVIRSEEEKLGGLPVTFNETHETQWISLCNVQEIHFKGSKFTSWNGRTDKDCIFKRLDREIATLEDIIKVIEKQLEEDPSGLNRANLFKAHAQLNMQLKREEDYWRQKPGYEWFKYRERNIKFFHTIVKGRRNRLRISFVQGRSITENVLVVKKIMSEIRKKGKPPNMVLKLDLMKAYDRVEWFVFNKGGSQVWKKILQARDIVQHLIVCQVKQGNSDIWLDNWTGQGDLYSIMEGADAQQSIHVHNLTLRGTILRWWNAEVKGREKPYYFAIPSMILWELWRRRNRKKHEDKETTGLRIIYNVTRNVRMLLKVRKPQMEFPTEWPHIIAELSKLQTRVKAITVLWKTPEEGWVKYNTNGAVREEKGGSFYVFCLRNEDGNVLFAKEEPQHYADSMQAEANAILQAAKHCSQLQHNKIFIQMCFAEKF